MIIELWLIVSTVCFSQHIVYTPMKNSHKEFIGNLMSSFQCDDCGYKCINQVEISTFPVIATEGETVYITFPLNHYINMENTLINVEHALSICESSGHLFEAFYSEIRGIEAIQSDKPLGQKCKFCGKIRRKKKEWVYE